MNTRNIDDKITMYFDLANQAKELKEQMDLLKKTIMLKMQTDNRDEYISKQGHKVTRYSTTRTMYVTKQLEALIPQEVLDKCKKVINSESLRLSEAK